MKTIDLDKIELLRMTTAGSVDDGKSTLIGQLLFNCNAIFEDQLAAIKESSKRRGKEEVDLALILDGLTAEREQGITIDVAYRYFSTPKRRFIIADVPGHEQYTRNMVTGASNANLAMILIDARKGLLKQSKRHLFIATLLGIPHILIVINKMDLVGYKEEIFEEIKEDCRNYASKLNLKDLQYIPISALKNDVVAASSDAMPWYKGPSVLDYLQNLEVTIDRNLIDFRLPIQYVIRPNQDTRGYAGTMEGGVIRKGEEVMVLPSGKKSKVKSILYNQKEVDYAFNPQSVVLTLEDEIDASRGDMIVKPNNTPQTDQEVDAMISWFCEEPLEKNKSYILKHTTKATRCFVSDIRYKIDIDNLHREDTDQIGFNEVGRVQIQTSEPIMYDEYTRSRHTGSFVLIDEQTNNTVGAAIVVTKKKTKETDLKSVNWQAKKGAVLWFTGLSGSGKTTIADKLFKFFKKNQIDAERLDGDVLRDSLCKDLGFSKEDRHENIERVAFLAEMLSKHNVLVLASFISPNRKQREELKKRIPNFVEIFVDVPFETCKKRDVKGLYKKATKGEIKDFTGLTSSYEEPKNPHLVLDTDNETEEESFEKVLDYLAKEKFIDGN